MFDKKAALVAMPPKRLLVLYFHRCLFSISLCACAYIIVYLSCSLVRAHSAPQMSLQTDVNSRTLLEY